MIRTHNPVPPTFRDLVVCHDNATPALTGGHITCQECGNVFDAYKYIFDAHTRYQDLFISSNLANDYARWSGDVNTPCKFPIIRIPGILPTSVTTSISRIWITTRLLQEVTSPFLLQERKSTYKKEQIMNNFVQELITILTNTDTNSQKTLIVKTILSTIKDMIGNGPDLFERYFSLSVPYVQKCAGNPKFPFIEREGTPIERFLEESRLASNIRQECSRYCVPFEVIYVLIYCYIAPHDIELLANLVYDLSARMCCGYFYVPLGSTPCDQHLLNIIHSETCTRQNRFTIKNIEEGQGSEILSLDFVLEYENLNRNLSNYFFQGNNTPEMHFAYAQNFPYVLFRGRDDDYLGFTIAMGYLINLIKSTHGKISKGSVQEAKCMYQFTLNFAKQIREYTKECSIEYWTNDIFELFLASTGLEEKFFKLLEMFKVSNKRREEEELKMRKMETEERMED